MNNIDYIFSPECIREGARTIFEKTKEGYTHFQFHQDKISPVVDYVMEVIRQNYPDLKIPFHSRWGHFRSGKVDRSLWLKKKIGELPSLEQARIKWDLVIPSVLLDAGAGVRWKYFEKETSKDYYRSEGLGVASFHLFMSGSFSSDGQSLRSDASGLSRVDTKLIEKYFQVTPQNPLVGIEGRTHLLQNLAKALENKSFFKDSRPGSLIDFLREEYGNTIKASDLLKSILKSLGSIWPGRESVNGVNLGDVWKHSRFGLVAFHKLSQWMTYSLIEPLIEAGIQVSGVEELTGLPEYRNGGLLIDGGILSVKNPKDLEASWPPGSDLIIEWRALTVYILDLIGHEVQKRLGKSATDFPLAKVLEGGTWWAGRKMATDLRPYGVPPLNIESDGTVF